MINFNKKKFLYKEILSKKLKKNANMIQQNEKSKWSSHILLLNKILFNNFHLGLSIPFFFLTNKKNNESKKITKYNHKQIFLNQNFTELYNNTIKLNISKISLKNSINFFYQFKELTFTSLKQYSLLKSFLTLQLFFNNIYKIKNLHKLKIFFFNAQLLQFSFLKFNLRKKNNE